MTCIAWDGKTLAGDRQSTSQMGYMGRVRKVHMIDARDHGAVLVGLSGGYDDAVLFLEYLRTGKRPDTALKNLNAIVIDRKKRLFSVEENLIFMPFRQKHYAAGSGRGVALAVMRMRGNAIKAVQIASQLLSDVGGGVDVVRFKS